MGMKGSMSKTLAMTSISRRTLLFTRSLNRIIIIEENLDYNQDDFQEIDGEVQDYGDEGYIEEGEF